MSWEKLCRPKDQGGIGIKDIVSFKEALLLKWKWNFFHQRDSLWEKLFFSKYGDGRNLGWKTLVLSHHYGGENDGQ